MTDRALTRVAARPAVTDWDEDEILTLFEAVALMFPDGAVTISTLRTAKRKRELATRRIAGADWTTIAHVREMIRPRLSEPAASRRRRRASPVPPPVTDLEAERARLLAEFDRGPPKRPPD
ncbi:hypothetical protein [Lichenibacterium dinghuense]|uniref:hypothetical protein n=1 Tax=Lichenibacterium dinghuense TaxID=2895977 RepID=UPI001F20ADC6|nr:hypothetical protein [Lichenibacterium sp. 6Y81]